MTGTNANLGKVAVLMGGGGFGGGMLGGGFQMAAASFHNTITSAIRKSDIARPPQDRRPCPSQR